VSGGGSEAKANRRAFFHLNGQFGAMAESIFECGKARVAMVGARPAGGRLGFGRTAGLAGSMATAAPQGMVA